MAHYNSYAVWHILMWAGNRGFWVASLNLTVRLGLGSQGTSVHMHSMHYVIGHDVSDINKKKGNSYTVYPH